MGMSPVTLVETKQYKESFRNWIKILQRGECLTIMFPPKSDRNRRFQQFSEDQIVKKTLSAKNLIFLSLNLESTETEDLNDLEAVLVKQSNYLFPREKNYTFEKLAKHLAKTKQKLILVNQQTENYLTPDKKHILSLLSQLIDRYYGSICVCSLCEKDITSPGYSGFLSSSSNLHQNLSYYPLYRYEDTLTFIHYLGKKWHYKLTQKTADQIWQTCGGYFWLVKEAVRQLHLNNLQNIKDEKVQDQLLFRTKAIFFSFSGEEQQVFEKSLGDTKNYSTDEHHSLHYLMKLRLLDTAGHIDIGVFKDYLKSVKPDESKLSLVNNCICANGVPIDGIFARKEKRFLALLLKNPHAIITRDRIGECLWPVETDKHYSDWAIDKLASRIRKELMNLKISPQRLKVIRGRGYLLNLD